MNPKILFLPVLLATAVFATAQIRDALEVQKGREDKLKKRGAATYYTERWDLAELPAYTPQQKVTGTIRLKGSNYFTDCSLAAQWEEGFKKFHPGIAFDWDLKTTLAAMPSLTFGTADIGPSRHATPDEILLFQRHKNYHPTEITVVTGSLNVPGWSYALGIFVHQDNPISQLTIEQLDGIFGAERAGAFVHNTWDTGVARGPEKNLRTWGQLGATGEWASKPIQVYGYNLFYHIPRTFERHVFQGGGKWNENLHEFTNYKNADGTTELEAKQVTDAIAKDRSGIGYSGFGFLTPDVKLVAIAPRGSKNFVPLNLATLRVRSYPLPDEVYFYLDRKPGEPVDQKVDEFVRYVLSREGQDAVQRDAKYLPLPATVVREQLKKLE